MEGATLVAWNVRGAFSQLGGTEAGESRIRIITNSLESVGAILAVISDGQLGPNDTWPKWTGYQIHGERSNKPNTVNVLVHDHFSGHIAEIPGVNSKRMIWSELPSKQPSARTDRRTGVWPVRPPPQLPRIGEAQNVGRYLVGI